MSKLTSPLRVGIVGTGFVAKLRAEILSQDPRVQLKAIAGSADKANALAQAFNIEAHSYWSELVVRPDLDLVVVANVNRDHGAVVAQALRAGKHVIVEYPLAFSYFEAEALVQLAQANHLLLHVEHLELLGAVHQTVTKVLPDLGEPFYARYVTQNPQRPAPDKWTYMPELFGFPLVAAVSRVHRLTALFGKVKSVACQLRYQGDALPRRYTSCICNAQLQFVSGLVADISYSKGEHLWKSERSMEIQGSSGAVLFEGESGKLITADGETVLTVDSPKGLFKRDTENVLDYLFDGVPLYTNSDSSLHAIAVACAAEKAAKTNTVIEV
ncbi:Gfo/Idh/MocA family protein [Tumidithrix helvetica]|uniref:Gfo/Idh/MocA family protein n=1 Tax=Tumidithrix helvetica TaxID=3457545 RepID=UPI003CC5B6D3